MNAGWFEFSLSQLSYVTRRCSDGSHRLLLGAWEAREVQEKAICVKWVGKVKEMTLLLQLYRNENGVSLLRYNPMQRHVDQIVEHLHLLKQKFYRYIASLQKAGQNVDDSTDEKLQRLKQRIVEYEQKEKYWARELDDIERRMIKVRRDLAPLCELDLKGQLTKERFRAAVGLLLRDNPLISEDAAGNMWMSHNVDKLMSHYISRYNTAC